MAATKKSKTTFSHMKAVRDWLSGMNGDTFTRHDIAFETGIPVQNVSIALSLLRREGVVTRIGHKQWQRVPEDQQEQARVGYDADATTAAVWTGYLGIEPHLTADAVRAMLRLRDAIEASDR